jgi:hypothetical protein
LSSPWSTLFVVVSRFVARGREDKPASITGEHRPRFEFGTSGRYRIDVVWNLGRNNTSKQKSKYDSNLSVRSSFHSESLNYGMQPSGMNIATRSNFEHSTIWRETFHLYHHNRAHFQFTFHHPPPRAKEVHHSSFSLDYSHCRLTPKRPF